MSGHQFVRPGQVSLEWPTPDNCMVCGQPEAAHRSAELSARRTAAAAVLGDYDRALHATNDAREVRWSYWAQRLGAEVRSLLEQLAVESLLDAEPSPLEQIRLVLDAFDWEHDDRQYALEQIDDILRSGR